MNQAVKAAVLQLDTLIDLLNKLPLKTDEHGIRSWKTDGALLVRLKEAIRRLSPPGSTYISASEKQVNLLPVGDVAIALRDDLANGFASTIADMLHADIFGDLIDAADHLISQGYKDAAAVMLGSTLESHIRQLCLKNGIGTTKPGTNEPIKTDTLNTELRSAGVYDLNVQKQVTALLGIRNSAAHGHYGDYDVARIKLYLSEVRHFTVSHPA